MNGQIISSVGHSAVSGAVKRVVRLNIGLNNNPYTSEQIINMLPRYAWIEIDSSFVAVGEWEGADEPTLVVTGLTDYRFEELDGYISYLALDLTQDAIAFKLGGEGSLTYRPDYVGFKYDFDEQYFI